MSEPRRHALHPGGYGPAETWCRLRAARHTKATDAACRLLGCHDVTQAHEPIVTEGITCPSCLDAIRKEIARLKLAFGPPKRPEIEGCGDTSCRCVAPRGMATNVGCRCDLRRVHAALTAWRVYAMDLEARVEGEP